MDLEQNKVCMLLQYCSKYRDKLEDLSSHVLAKSSVLGVGFISLVV